MSLILCRIPLRTPDWYSCFKTILEKEKQFDLAEKVKRTVYEIASNGPSGDGMNDLMLDEQETAPKIPLNIPCVADSIISNDRVPDVDGQYTSKFAGVLLKISVTH